MSADGSTDGTGLVSRMNIVFGLFVTGYGFLLIQQSAAQAVFVVGIGLVTLLSGIAGTAWAAERFDLGAPEQRQLRTLFAVVAILLLGVFFTVF